MNKKGKANDIDVFVGARLKEFRKAKGISQQKVADSIDITFQQEQKYERGTNRIAAGRLFYLSKVLGVSIEAFFPQEDVDMVSYNGFTDNLIDDSHGNSYVPESPAGNKIAIMNVFRDSLLH